MRKVLLVLLLFFCFFLSEAEIKISNESVVVGSGETVSFGEKVMINSKGRLESAPNSLVRVSDTLSSTGVLDIQGSVKFEKKDTDYLSLDINSNLIIGEAATVGEWTNLKLLVKKPIQVSYGAQVKLPYGLITTEKNLRMTESSTNLLKERVLILEPGSEFLEPLDTHPGAVDGAVIIESIPTETDKFLIPFKKYVNESKYERRFFTIYKENGAPALGAKITFFSRDPLGQSFDDASTKFFYNVAPEFWKLEIIGPTTNNITVGITSYKSISASLEVQDYVYYNTVHGEGTKWIGPISPETVELGKDLTYMMEFELKNFEKGYISPALEGSEENILGHVESADIGGTLGDGFQKEVPPVGDVEIDSETGELVDLSTGEPTGLEIGSENGIVDSETGYETGLVFDENGKVSPLEVDPKTGEIIDPETGEGLGTFVNLETGEVTKLDESSGEEKKIGIEVDLISGRVMDSKTGQPIATVDYAVVPDLTIASESNGAPIFKVDLEGNIIEYGTDEDTGLTYDPETGEIIDPLTGGTGLAIDKVTGEVIVLATGQSLGQVESVETGEPIGNQSFGAREDRLGKQILASIGSVSYGDAFKLMTPNGDGKNDGFFINMVAQGKKWSLRILKLLGNSQIVTIYKSENYENGSWKGDCSNSMFCTNNGRAKEGGYYYIVVSDDGKEQSGWLRIEY
jgi:predicted aconitase with swiveling domain